MDKNIAALLREDTKTVSVRFIDDYTLSKKAYTYVTDIDLKVDDLAVVFVGLLPKLVIVRDVHDSVQIEHNDTLEYEWIVAKVDKNAVVTSLVGEAYKKNLRNQFSQLLFGSMSKEARLKLLHTLKGNNMNVDLSKPAMKAEDFVSVPLSDSMMKKLSGNTYHIEDTKTNVDSTLSERGNRYGTFIGHADITQTFKNLQREFCLSSKTVLSPSQQEALDMIFHKIGRILNGDPNYADSWHDIAGYASLVDKELNGEIK